MKRAYFAEAIYVAIAALVLSAPGESLAQDMQSKDSQTATSTKARIKLTPGQQRTIYQYVVNQREPELRGEFPVAVGAKVPSSLTLKELPKIVQMQIEPIKKYKFVKINDNLLLVDPKNRMVVEVITRDEGTL